MLNLLTIKKDFLPKVSQISGFSNYKLRVCVDNFRKGMANTIGFSLRRVLFSFVPGYAITRVKIDGVLHEYSTKEGLHEDLIDVLVNLRGVCFCNTDREEIELFLFKTGGIVTAGDFKVPHDVIIMNPDKVIANLSDFCTLNMVVCVSRGYGYVPVVSPTDTTEDSEILEESDTSIKGNWIYLDAFFSPVRKVNYEVSVVDQLQNFEKLILDVETDGSVSPSICIRYAVNVLIEQFKFFVNFDVEDKIINPVKLSVNPILLKEISVLGLSARAYNCLLAENIVLVGDLIQKFEVELIRFHNFGKKSLCEIKETLTEKGLALGMYVENWDKIKEKRNFFI